MVNIMSKKMGFWSVVALVIGSQIGTGILMLPASLAMYGEFGLLGWCISGGGAIALGCVFGWLCMQFPETGGPHAYVKHAFGSNVGFFTGWTYWIISWVSTSVVVITCISYLAPIAGYDGKITYLILEIGLLLIITGLNLKGLQVAGRAEFFLTLLKFIPFLILPICALTKFDYANIEVSHEIAINMSADKILAHATMLTLWGFIGLESATTPAGSVENPAHTVPKAIIYGTAAVFFLYLFNSIAVMGMIPSAELAVSKAPYSALTQRLWGGNWHMLISFIAGIICIGTLNAWVLTSGQIGLGLAESKMFPAIFKQKNKSGAPIGSLCISTIGIIPILIMTANDNLAKQITEIIDISVTSFIFVYLICSISYLKLSIEKKFKATNIQLCVGAIAILFCSWILWQTSSNVLLIATIFTISGFPMFLYNKRALSS